MKSSIRRWGRNLANIKDLEEIVKEVWEEIPGENHKELKNGYQKGQSGYNHILRRCTYITANTIVVLPL